ncbi:hypothetical protein ACS0TY_035891 [Phlomoides rotata]
MQKFAANALSSCLKTMKEFIMTKVINMTKLRRRNLDIHYSIPKDIFASFMNAASSGEGGSGDVTRKAAPIERNLPCSPEDLYKGTTRKMKISRDCLETIGINATSAMRSST